VIDGLVDLVELGRGGFGTVYQARQVDLGRAVAVKVLPDVRADTEAYGRFVRECRALGALGGHPNIATVFGCGLTDDGSGYLSLELLPGGSLADRVAAGASSWESVGAWGVALAGALETAHRAGITHRDIKPENVLFDGLGTPKLLDFGIAGVPGAFRTATGAVTLTLSHAAPEVVAGGRGGVPADVYSLASTLFAALAGRAAFTAPSDETLVPMLARIASAPVPDLRPDGVPDEVCSVIERGMAKDPADRPASAEELGVALRAALAEHGVAVPAPPLLAVTPLDDDAAVAALAAPALLAAAGTDVTVTRGTPTGPPPATGSDPALAETVRSDRRHERRATGWAFVAGAAVLAAGLLGWQAYTASQQPAPLAGPSQSSTASGSSSASPRPSTTPKPGRSTAPSGTRSAAPVSTGGAAQGATSAPDVPPTTPAPTKHSSPTPTPKTSPTPTPTPVPSQPTGVRTTTSTYVGGQVEVSLTFTAPTGGPRPTGYDVVRTQVGGSAGGSTTTYSWGAVTSGTVSVAAPPTGVRYVWSVRSRIGTQVSAASKARVTVPKLVGLVAWQARDELRAVGLSARTTTRKVTSTRQYGKVVAQGTKAGSVVGAGTVVGITVGSKQ
jgi:serine/threonine protein kinase